MGARLDPILALLLSPFVGTCCVVLAIVLGYTFRVLDRSSSNPYMAAWGDREPGDLP